MSDTLEEFWRQARTDEGPPIAKTVTAKLQQTVREVQLHTALGGAAKRKKEIPAAAFPHGDERDYAAAIIAVAGSGMLRRVLAPILADLPKLVRDAELQRSGVTPIVDPGKRIADVIEVARRMLSRSTAADMARRYAKRVADHQRVQLAKQLKAALGVDIMAVKLGGRLDARDASLHAGGMRHDARSFRLDAVSGRIEGFASENATLITALGNQSLDDIAKTLTRSLADDAANAAKIHADIQARFGVLDSYARRISRDQVGKLNGRVAMDRHNELGVTSFHWQSMEDPDVRELHQEINGNEYDYPDGHPTEGLPGDPYGCRCVAIPVLAPVVQAVDEPPPDEEPAPAPENQIAPPTRLEPEPKKNQIAPPVTPKPTPKPEPKPAEKPDEKIKPITTHEEAQKFLDNVGDGKLSATEQAAIFRYQGGTYIDINEYARTNKLDPGSVLSTKKEAKETLAAIDSAIAKGTTPEDVVVFRGFRPEGAAQRDGITGTVEVGQTITDKGYTSTSMSKDTASEFGSVLLEIEVPKGTNAAFVPADGGMQESELLLGRGASFKVLEVREENGKKIARVRLEGPAPAAVATTPPAAVVPPPLAIPPVVAPTPPVEPPPAPVVAPAAEKTKRELRAEARAQREAMAPPKNPKRVAAAKVAAAASAERRREIHSAVKSNLSPDLQTVWDKEGHKFLQQEAGRIKGEKDRINASSKISQAFAETYGSGENTAHGNEGDRYAARAEIEAAHAESWADEQEAKYYEQEQKNYEAEVNSSGDVQPEEPAPEETAPTETSSSDDDPPF